MSELAKAVDLAVAAIRQADGLLITAGAGMGVDSGLPDFRGNEGFWAAYPALAKAQINFRNIATPGAFFDEPRLAWGFYGHRLQLYRDTVPHAGFAILKRIADSLLHGAFVFTSNVDGQFQKAGFGQAQVCECHGSIHHLQCVGDCEGRTWSADAFQPKVDADTCRLLSPLPTCSACGNLARPNILMFDDTAWNARRTQLQHLRLERWLAAVERLVIIELGAGTAIPTVRDFGESQAGVLIRINPSDTQIERRGDVVLQVGALEGISVVFQRFRQR